MNLAEAFRARGYDARLAALYPPRDEAPMPAIGDLSWEYARPEGVATRAGGIALFWSLVRLLRRVKPDVVLTALPAAGVLAPLAARVAGIDCQVIVSHHTPVDTYSSTLNRLDGITGRMPNVRAVVSVSKAVNDSLGERSANYRARTHVIHNALPPAVERTLAELRARREARAEGVELVAIGRLAPQKNYPALLRAMARVEGAHLTIVGAGTEEEALRALAGQLALGKKVTFAGQIDRAGALALLADSDVFVQVSLFEGHSLALIEASTIGLPLIVSRVPSQVEGVTDPAGRACGILVEQDDDAGLAAEIGKLLGDPEYRAFWTRLSGELGKSTTFARTVDAYEALLARVVPSATD